MHSTDHSVRQTLHSRLRAQTREGHRNAEKAMDLNRRLASIHTYGELLGRLWRLHSAYEASLSCFDWSQVNVHFDTRRRAQWLKDDMVALGLGASEPWTLSYSIDSIEAALGSLYVLEGSSLGGQVIQRQALQVTGVSVTHGARFFCGHGNDTANLWKEFLRSLNLFDPNSVAAAVIECSALRTFEEFALVLGERT